MKNHKDTKNTKALKFLPVAIIKLYHIRLIDTPVETLNLRKVGCLDGLANAKHFP
jgi:hypothetical protein